MKKTLFILIFFTSFFLYSQSSSISGYVLYDCYFPSKKVNVKSSKIPLYFNNTISLQISSLKKSSKINSSTDEESVSLTLPYGDDLGRQIYVNIKEKAIITRRPNNAISEAFIVKEDWFTIDWKITNKTKTIGSYIATEAKGSFRGRDYTVWFTYDIPVPFGPWKLHGLPGLILEAEDSEKMMRFYATEIKIPFTVDKILNKPKAVNQITHKEEVYMQDNFDELLAKKMNARLPKGSSIRPMPNSDGRKFREELVYEWEKK